MIDFTLERYGEILDAALDAGYRTTTVHALFAADRIDEPHVVLRHDVDRRPTNAVAMATAEADRDIQATYYFRIIPQTFKPALIREIAGLGHEIGYHYEDFHMARYQPARAFDMFRRHVEELRAIAPISTIAMHGSPLAKFNNMTLWDHHRYDEADVKDCILSYDWSDYAFFTDTGRSFGENRANLRDRIGGQSFPEVTTSAELAAFLRECRWPKIQLSTHPERWNPPGSVWMLQLGQDLAVNTIKRGLSYARRTD
ncbi:MAG: hypothetical protein R3F54_21780 [Alphaproteobacteria bacterium]